MEKIDLLLEQLENRIPQSLAKKIDKLDDLNDKLEVAEQEFLADDSDENNESLSEIKDYIEEFEQEIVEQLEALNNKRKEDDAKAKAKVVAQQKPVVETPKVVTPTTEIPSQENKEEKKEGSGVLGLVIGGILLVGSLGAINYFKNNR
jgi:hypothetical protein